MSQFSSRLPIQLEASFSLSWTWITPCRAGSFGVNRVCRALGNMHGAVR